MTILSSVYTGFQFIQWLIHKGFTVYVPLNDTELYTRNK
jgi:hypothetical protein